MSKLSISNEHDPAFPPTPARSATPDWYSEMLASVSVKVPAGRTRAISAVNQALVATYWAVGKELLVREASDGWGAKVVLRLASDLKERFPESRGFSPRNLRYMKAFAEAWPDFQMLQTPSATLPWSHFVALLEKFSDTETRLW